jgi:hypothetical protein
MELRFGLVGGKKKHKKTLPICSGFPSHIFPGLKKELLKGSEKNSTKWFNFFMKFEALTVKGFRLDLLIFGN